MSGLSQEQRAVVQRLDRPVLVTAGPGSGKTRTLVSKFLQLVSDGVPAERILALTFSQKAAVEMQRRVQAARRRSVRQLWISTFHSFGHALVSRFPVEAGLPRSFRLLTGFKEWVLVRDVLEQVSLSSELAAAVEHRALVKEVAGAIGLFKHGGVTPEALEASLAGLPDEALLRDLCGVYRGYEAELRARRHFDYRDLIGRARRLLEESEAVRGWAQGQFDAVLIDELQDIDPGQLGLVTALVSGSELAQKVTAFGDVNQSIYGFRGALPEEVLTGFREAFAGLEEMELSVNHRSLAPLVALSERVIPAGQRSAGSDRGVKGTHGEQGRAGVNPAPTLGESAEQVDVLGCPTSLSEATGIARELKRLHRTKRADGEGTYRWRDMAVLVRSLKKEAKAIEGELARLGVPYRVYGNTGFYHDPAVGFLVNYVLALVDEDDDSALRRVMASPVAGLPQLPLARFLSRVRYRGRHAGRYLWFMRFLMEAEDAERWPIWRPDKSDQEEAEDEKDRERREHRQVKPPYFYRLMSAEDKDAFHAFHTTFLLLRGRARRAKDALPALIGAMASLSGLTAWILAQERESPRRAARHGGNVGKLQAMVREFTEIALRDGKPPVLEDLGEHLKTLLAHFAHEGEVEPPEELYGEAPDAVTLMTVHQAKGLEFDVVCVPHLVTGRFPRPPLPSIVLSEESAEGLKVAHPGFRDPGHLGAEAQFEEERRLFYVALTRARERLVLSWARRYDGEEDDSAPSPFLVEALGGREVAFWERVHGGGLSAGEALAELAAASGGTAAKGGPVAVRYRDLDARASLEEAVGREDVEVALRRLVGRLGEEDRRSVAAAVQREGAPAVDWTFVSGRRPFPVEKQRPLALDPKAVQLSASRLSDFRSCPRKFFYSKLLHLQPPSRAPAVFGTAVHEVLATFHDAHPDKQAFADAGQARELGEELRAALHAEITKHRESFSNPFDFRRQLAAADAMITPYLAYLAEEPLRHVAGRELTVEFEAQGAAMVAKIDRVVADAAELGEAGAVLIGDYKTTPYPIDKGRSLQKKIVKGDEIQLVTYYKAYLQEYGVAPEFLSLIYLRCQSAWRPGTLQVLLRVMEKADAKGTEFWGLSSKKWTDRAWISAAELEAAWESLEREVSGIVSPTRTRFRVTPGKACRWCSYSAVCGKEEEIEVEGAGADD